MLIDVSGLLFYLLAGLAMASALSVVLVSNPIYSALSLALTMLSVSGLFFHLEAYFLAGVQLIVYAGAVVILFVMVLMLFDLKEEKKAFSGGLISFMFKVILAGLFLGVVSSVIGWTFKGTPTPRQALQDGTAQTKELAIRLFSEHLISFELTGVLLLVVLVGAIVLAKAKGGTHAR
ncbi:MAG: NADH-quinone oxidoreductase subunit J [Bdellovibrionales bacterium CG10_big_fil_rev_8_21_14_0_10_45_34]|nr:MAG: NADH-quinone oxidoreductase subunit J [Bdellovibrionales bacterium CG10_big_fil_rev_8_21_14_0_10_45_34]